MKERPILFSTPMVRAVLDGTKTQTRRVVKPQPSHFNPVGVPRLAKPEGSSAVIGCPYGQPGDRLWVRETWRSGQSYGGDYPTVQYRATETALIGSAKYPVADVMAQKFGIASNVPHAILAGGKWKPSIHMPRWASRITLEVTGVRVERLQDISEEDAVAEGVEAWESIENAVHWDADLARPDTGWWRDYSLTPEEEMVGVPPLQSARDSFRTLWEKINGPGSWDTNAWVWVVEFKRLG